MVFSILARHFITFILILYTFAIQAESDVPRPRGVSLSKAPLYSPSKDFTCFDGTVTIPFSYVNDDYCDCFDGSDEPGTSACLNGVFHCVNAGHRAQNLPSSRVNDGVCDCCDGTDEYATSTACENTCEELGQEARAEAQRLVELHKAGSQLKVEFIDKGNKKRQQMAEELSQLEKDKEEAEKIKSEREAYKNELEAKENEALKVYREAEEQERLEKAELERVKNEMEALEHFKRYDSDTDGVLTTDEIKVVNAFDKNKDGEVDEDEIKYFFNDSESVDSEGFISTTWPLLKSLLILEQGLYKPAEPELDDEQEVEPDTEDQTADAGESDPDEDEENDELAEDFNENQDTQQQPPTGIYDEDTQKLVNEATEARRQLTEAERTVREIDSSIRNIQQNLEKDYGLQQEFATLDGQCYEHEDKEYVYKLCLFQKVTQKSRSGGAEIGLGNWGEWTGEPKSYTEMKYTNGIACWNGPNRMTTVHIQCGLESKILSVTEPFRCEYLIEFSTPAVCDDAHATQQTSSHDEL